jgi:potassium-dependent mechanosensitive channel
VIYGSPVPETRRLLLKAVQENDRVIKKPEPFVLFQDFGDNALIFDVFFWIRVNKIIERRTIESSVRFNIDDLFRKAGLVIAFPQQDVHLDMQKPLELKWVNGAGSDTVSGGGTSKYSGITT